MKLHPWRAAARLLSLALTLAACQGAGSTAGSADPIVARIDSIAAARLATGQAAGFSIGVMKGSDTVLMKGYGSADLELDVPTPAGAVYEIGSVTKQFTAAAIMQLRDSGKLSLDDDLSKHFPDYPMQGQRVSIRRLLDHTSGIKGYTEMPTFGQLMVRDLPKDTLVAAFSREKFEFAPGTLEVYNNSAYFLAGLLIEKLSGMSYADYVRKNLFDKAGMASSDYCSEKLVMKKKVKGYEYGPDSTLRHKGFLVHTWPYAAGSLCSTVRDLVAWNRALHHGQVLSQASYTEMITPGVLNDGTKLRYGTGLALRTVGGHRLIEHGGGINGFVSASHYYPDDSLAVVVLINTVGPMAADPLAVDVAMSILGREPAKTETFSGDLNALAGEYVGVSRGQTMRARVTIEDGKPVLRAGPDRNLVTPTPEPKPVTMTYLGGGTWADDETHYVFSMSGAATTELRIDSAYGYSILTRVK
jgi:CubicO group peptidase (beta-lactamase class C family)